MRHGLFVGPSSLGRRGPRLYGSTDREIREALLELLNRAEQTIDVEMYVLTDDEVVLALERAEARGVQVRVILDPNQSSNQKHVERLKVHGVEVKWFPVNKPAQMHRKLAIVDGKRLFAGSVNWSYNGLARNEELMLLVEDPEIARKLDEIFELYSNVVDGVKRTGVSLVESVEPWRVGDTPQPGGYAPAAGYAITG